MNSIIFAYGTEGMMFVRTPKFKLVEVCFQERVAKWDPFGYTKAEHALKKASWYVIRHFGVVYSTKGEAEFLELMDRLAEKKLVMLSYNRHGRMTVEFTPKNMHELASVLYNEEPNVVNRPPKSFWRKVLRGPGLMYVSDSQSQRSIRVRYPEYFRETGAS